MAAFWSGLWQGFIAPFAFVLSRFRDEIVFYKANNSGTWYDFGFLPGASLILAVEVAASPGITLSRLFQKQDSPQEQR